VTGRLLRYGLGAAGLAALGFGLVTLVTDPQVRDWPGVAEWLVLAVALHDGVLVPLVLLAGLGLGLRWRSRLRLPFVLAGSLTAVALPVLLRPGPTADPSVLPLDYVRGWAVAVGVAVALGLLPALVPAVRGSGVRRVLGLFRRARSRRRAGTSDQ
jgi:hypothetical protein